jgi:hypothetical protein
VRAAFWFIVRARLDEAARRSVSERTERRRFHFN